MVDSKRKSKISFSSKTTKHTSAYVLFLERINPTKMLLRVAPISQEKKVIMKTYIAIEQEFEHNLTQQLYLSDASWTIILTAKTVRFK
jgi:alpha-tubulin suppressor-like RCC1 family protein